MTLTQPSFTDKPKYVCPRDKVRTCSLACYKRHQQRASCNGQRDPTAYVKKNDLTTPAGIDHDFNFLSGIERTFDKAGKDLHDRGMESTSNVRKRWQSDGPLQRYIRENNIVVDRAPVGMSRQKTNQTRYLPKSKRIVWTVEWIDIDGIKRLSEVHEAATLGDSYAAMLAEREKESKKRKRDLDNQFGKDVKRAVAADEEGQTTGQAQSSTQEEGQATAPAQAEPSSEMETLEEDGASNETMPPEAEIQPKEDPTTESLPESPHPTPAETTSTNTNNQAPSSQPPPTFYLLTPHTSSTSTVLTPLSSTKTLTANLSSRTILEYPTIYTFPPDIAALPPGFVSAQDYVEEKAEEERELEEMLKAVPGAKREDLFGRQDKGGVEGKTGTDWDEGRILEMLKRDVGAARGDVG